MEESQRRPPATGRKRPKNGTIYLLHFSENLAHARHYLGWSSNLGERIQAHRTGRGARLMEVCMERGITFEVARVWKGDRNLERRLKNRGGHSRLCPICRPGCDGAPVLREAGF